MMDHKHNEDIREMEITNINYTIKNCQKWLQHLERMPENQIPKMLEQYTIEDRRHHRRLAK